MPSHGERPPRAGAQRCVRPTRFGESWPGRSGRDPRWNRGDPVACAGTRWGHPGRRRPRASFVAIPLRLPGRPTGAGGGNRPGQTPHPRRSRACNQPPDATSRGAGCAGRGGDRGAAGLLLPLRLPPRGLRRLFPFSPRFHPRVPPADRPRRPRGSRRSGPSSRAGAGAGRTGRTWRPAAEPEPERGAGPEQTHSGRSGTGASAWFPGGRVAARHRGLRRRRRVSWGPGDAPRTPPERREPRALRSQRFSRGRSSWPRSPGPRGGGTACGHQGGAP